MLGGNALGWAYLGRGYAGANWKADSGTCTLGIAASGAEAIRADPAIAVCTIGIAGSGAETLAASPKYSLTRVAITRPTPRVIIPGYVYPGAAPRTTWDAWIAAADPVSHIIANPGSPGGPGTSTDTNYAAVIAQAQAAGITILGYVDTNYARPDVSTPVLDDFNSGASQLLTARTGWDATALTTGSTSLTTNATPTLAQKSSGAGSAFRATPYTDCEARAKFASVTGSATDLLRIITRWANATQSGYGMDIWLDGTLRMYRFEVAGGTSQFVSMASGFVPAIGDEMALRSFGTVHQAWYKPAAGTWTMITSFDDAVSGVKIPGPGLIGLYTNSTGSITADLFGGGAVGTTPLSQIDAWKTLYGINDIFFDQTPSGAADLPYIKLLTNYVRASSTIAGAVTLLNPGTMCDEGYAALADILCVFEGTEATYATYTPSSWNANYPANRFLHLVYNAATRASLTADIAQAVTQGAGYVDVVDTAVWFALSALWSDQTTYLRSSPAAALADSGTCTLTLSPSGASALGDASTQSETIVVGGSEALRDAGVLTLALAPGGSDILPDAGSVALTLATSGSEASADSGAASVALLPSGSELLPDAGTASLTITPLTSEALSDSGLLTVTLAPVGAEAIEDTSDTVVQLDHGATGVLGGLMFGEYPRAARVASNPAFVITGTGSIVITASDPHAFAVVQGQAYLNLWHPDDIVYPDTIVYPDAIPYGGDGILDVGAAAAGVLASGAQSVTGASASDTGLVVPTILAAGVEAFSDAAATTATLTASSVEQITDAGTATLVLSPSASEVETDTGSLTLTLSPSAAEVASDAGSITVALAPAGAEQLSDTTTTTVSIAPSGADSPADAAAITFAIAASGGEIATDAAASTVGVTPTGADAISDGVTDTLTITAIAIAGVLGADPSDLGTATIVVDGSSFNAQDQGLTFSTIQPAGAELLADAGTAAIGIAGSSAEATSDLATQLVAISASGAESQADSSQATLAASGIGSEAISDTAAAPVTVTPSGADAPTDAGTASVTLLATGLEQAADAAIVTLTLLPDATVQLTDQATAIVTLLPASTDQQIDAGTVSFLIDQTGSFSVTAGNPSDAGSVVLAITVPQASVGGECEIQVDGSGFDSISATGSVTITVSTFQLGTSLIWRPFDATRPRAGVGTRRARRGIERTRR